MADDTRLRTGRWPHGPFLLYVLFERAQQKKGFPKLVEPTTTQPQFRKGLEFRCIAVDQVKMDGKNRTGAKKSDVPRA